MVLVPDLSYGCSQMVARVEVILKAFSFTYLVDICAESMQTAGTAGALWESLPPPPPPLLPHGDLGITGLITWWLEAP